METDRQAHWLHPLTALNYARAAVQVGLWKSEEILVSQYFHRDDHLLELGCGGGRAGLGLWQKGYQNLTITDFSPVMVDMTRHVFDEIAPNHLAKIETANACSLHYADESFDGVLFAFNGLMCLRGREDRQKALPEIFRVLKPGGIFLFTANDREKGENVQAWALEPTLPDGEPGDRWHETESTPVFMHSSTESETLAELNAAGFKILQSKLRSEIASENAVVKNFAGETRFYVAQKV
jgi:ubiquinone/menaquinone biosynthesis C-methylase UbiE